MGRYWTRIFLVSFLDWRCDPRSVPAIQVYHMKAEELRNLTRWRKIPVKKLQRFLWKSFKPHFISWFLGQMPNGPLEAYFGGFQNGMITPKNVVLRDNSLKPVLQSTNYVILKIFKIETFWSTLTAQIILLDVIGMCSIHFMKFFCFLRGHTFWLTQNSCCVYLSFIWLLFRKYRNISLISVALSPPKLSHSAGVWGETGRSGNQGRQGFRVYVWLLGFKKV